LRSVMSEAEGSDDWAVRRERLGIPSKLKGKSIPKAHGNWVPPGNDQHEAQPAEDQLVGQYMA
jgi:hypothetical protein